ncbi:protocatechuate 3,4-dioxygenase subunit alpha [uncultured Sneathiella sp.]|uniref:protocatechuate 3,4-dioxygenase subunit alpha n=1 Tax=uncultured Sneathiella sp. TaxID=879315 RepID=UPI0030ED8B29|tara:strand:- start:36567 stop:37181 length:615 start_codon:yes stop_codon:yes gene_type:complete
MTQPLTYFKETPSQTAGPYVHIGLAPNFTEVTGIYDEDLGRTLINDLTEGERLTVTGRVLDGMGVPLKDALVEIWQADAKGLYNSPSEIRGQADPNFTGWGRCPSDMERGVFTFETIKPGSVPFKDGRPMAPHIAFWVVARGINLGLHTRMYFSDEETENANDPVLARIEHRDRVSTLIGERNGNNVTFDIHLQGDRETVFFDL